jgi:hypothetical protein
MSYKNNHVPDEQNVEMRIAFEGKVVFVIPTAKNKVAVLEGHVFHRKDYHEDGSISDWYGIDMTEEEYMKYMATRNTGMRYG